MELTCPVSAWRYERLDDNAVAILFSGRFGIVSIGIMLVMFVPLQSPIFPNSTPLELDRQEVSETYSSHFIWDETWISKNDVDGIGEYWNFGASR
jgi:hypothetical protein